MLLISGSEVGKRTAQHRTVIEAAKAEGVDLLAYTSVANADTSGTKLAKCDEPAPGRQEGQWTSSDYRGYLALVLGLEILAIGTVEIFAHPPSEAATQTG